ncbi:MAG: glycosyltransferase family 39 protein [Dehalococcoidia bacterium]|nr:glycosyltransferase family 39 protein [Dehalococcoidia bacterium]
MRAALKPYAAPLLIIAVAAFLRFYQLDSVPTGLSHDEAMNGVDALDVIYNGYHPLYFERNQGGREPLFIYLTTAAVYIWGAVPFAMRLVPAFIGTLTVGMTFAFANRLFGRRTALVSAALIALSDWHVHFSRTSLRAVSFPLMAILALFLLWQAIASGRTRYFVLAGLASGLAMYTYFSSRLLPAILAAFLVYMIALHRRKVSWRGVALFCITATIVFAPLGYYYFTHQQMFFARVDQVSALNQGTPSDPFAGLWQNTRNTLLMFNVLGDIFWKYNLPGKPIFETVGFVMFLIGLALAVVRSRRNSAAALMVIWLVIMILPGALSVESPSFIRSLGAIPAIFILPAMAFAEIWSRLANFMSRHSLRLLLWLLPIATVIWFASIGLTTFRDYFVVWGQATDTYYAFDTEMTEIGRFLSAQTDDSPVVLSSRYYLHPSVLFMLRRNVALRWTNASQSIVLPDFNRKATFILPLSAMPRKVSEVFPARDLIASIPGPDDTTAFVAYRSNTTELRQTVMDAMPQKFGEGGLGDNVDLLKYRLGLEVKAGETMPFDILWRVRQIPKPYADIAFFSHLVDQQWQMWGQGDGNEYPAAEWAQNDLVLGNYDLKTRPDTPPGQYFVDIGIYDRRTGERMLFSGKDKPNHVLIGPVKVKRAQPFPASSIRFPVSAALTAGIQFLGYDLQNAQGQPALSARTGESLKVPLYWQATARQNADYTVFLHLLDGDNKVVAQDDAQPSAGRFPTTIWDIGETVVDEHPLAIPPALTPGDYNLEAGIYLKSSGVRLNVGNNGQVVSDHLVLGKLKVEAK